jgi:hypothetical protein
MRPARDAELTVVAGLRWQWVLDDGDRPALPRDAFAGEFARWARENAGTHRCLAAVRGGTVTGMPWPATLPRVPTPQAFDLRSGDVQCVYVVPGERDNGVDGRLVDALPALTRELRSRPTNATGSPCLRGCSRPWPVDRPHATVGG